MEGSLDVVLSSGPDLSLRVGGVTVLKNCLQVVVVCVRPEKGLGPQILDGHGTAAGEAHPVSVGSTAVGLKVVLGDR
jgi:hypothetical protein